MLFLFMFTFGFPSCSDQKHVIIHGVIQFGMDPLSEGFLKAIEQMIPNVPRCFCLRDPIWMFKTNFVQFTL